MTGFAVRAFRGMVPRTSERLIGDNMAIAAFNCNITRGQIVPIKGLGLVHTSLAASLATIYRYRYLDEYQWLVSTKVVDFAKSPVARDTLGRFYYSGDGEPRMSTYADAISGPGLYPAAWYVLGVYYPVTAPTIAVTGGVGVNEDRTYVYTFVNQYGEESGPSLQKTFTGKVDGSWDLSNLEVAPPNTGTVTAALANTPLPGQVQITLNTARGLAGYEEVTFAGVAGMTDLKGTFSLVSVNLTTNTAVIALATAQVYTAGGTWARRAPHNLTGLKKNIYRTVGTNTDYKFVASIAAATTTYSDTIAAAVVSLNAGISTLDNFPPPKNMHSLVLLANGCLAGLAGNEFCMSEAGKPYSWPIAYRFTFPGTGVGLVAAGNAAIILTDSYPLVAAASVPASCSIDKVPGDVLAPCVSKRGIVDIGSGAIFPSHDGLYVATTGGCTNTTANLATFDEWQPFKPASFKSAFANGRYYAMHDSVALDQKRILMLATREPDSFIEHIEQVDTLYGNPWDGKLYVTKGNKIYEWDADANNKYKAFWQMKEYQSGKPFNLSVCQVQGRFSEIIPVNNTALTANQALVATGYIGGELAADEVGVLQVADSNLLPVPVVTQASMQVTLIKGGVPMYSVDVTSSDPFRLPGDEMSDLHSLQISTSITIDSITAAQGMAELSQAGQ